MPERFDKTVVEIIIKLIQPQPVPSACSADRARLSDTRLVAVRASLSSCVTVVRKMQTMRACANMDAQRAAEIFSELLAAIRSQHSVSRSVRRVVFERATAVRQYIAIKELLC